MNDFKTKENAIRPLITSTDLTLSSRLDRTFALC
jgi:hypothetical protein